MADKFCPWKLVVLPDGYEFEDEEGKRPCAVRKLKKDKERYKKENKHKEVDDERGTL